MARGRPEKPYGAHLIITQIRLPGPVKRRLEALSEATGYAQQELMRRAVDEYVSRHIEKGTIKEPEPAPPPPVRRMFKRPGMSAAA